MGNILINSQESLENCIMVEKSNVFLTLSSHPPLGIEAMYTQIGRSTIRHDSSPEKISLPIRFTIEESNNSFSQIHAKGIFPINLDCWRKIMKCQKYPHAYFPIGFILLLFPLFFYMLCQKIIGGCNRVKLLLAVR